jgi:hypothetical protein
MTAKSPDDGWNVEQALMVGNKNDGPPFWYFFKPRERDFCPYDEQALYDQEIQYIDGSFMCTISPTIPANHLNGMEYDEQEPENNKVYGG